MSERNWERFFDMLIYQSFSNEEKVGSDADSVGSKLRDIQQDIVSAFEKLDKIEKVVIPVTNSTPETFIESAVKLFAHKIRDIIRGDEIKAILEGKK